MTRSHPLLNVLDYKRPAAITHAAFVPHHNADTAPKDFPFFLASADTTLYSVTLQACVSIAFLPAAPHSLLFNPEGDTLLAITQNMNVIFLEVADGSALVKRELKVSGRAPHAFTWVRCVLIV